MLDALDALTREGAGENLEDLLNLFRDLMNEPQHQTHVLVTSVRDLDSRELMDRLELPYEDLRMEHYLDQDLSAYLDIGVDRLATERKWSHASIQTAHARLHKVVDG